MPSPAQQKQFIFTVQGRSQFSKTHNIQILHYRFFRAIPQIFNKSCMKIFIVDAGLCNPRQTIDRGATKYLGVLQRYID
jgi:hypothetical protein